ncbi:Diacylglycerol kinase [Rhodotorula kratochvilovae]
MELRSRARAQNGQTTGEDKGAQPHVKAPPAGPLSGSSSSLAPDRVDRGRWRSGLEIPRKLLHSSIAGIVLYLWTSHQDVPRLLSVLAVATTVVGTADVLRFRSTWFERTYENALGYFMRESERHAVNGTIYYLVGVLWCLSLYPRDIAVLSIIMLSLCDTSASVFGRLFGRYTPRLPFAGSLFGAKKSLAGTLAAVVVGMVASYVFWSRWAALGDEADVSWLPARMASVWRGKANEAPLASWGIKRLPNPQSTLGLSTLVVVNGLTAGLAEAIDFFGFDDNLSLPVLFGLFCWASMYVLG